MSDLQVAGPRGYGGHRVRTGRRRGARSKTASPAVPSAAEAGYVTRATAIRPGTRFVSGDHGSGDLPDAAGAEGRDGAIGGPLYVAGRWATSLVEQTTHRVALP